MFRREESYTVKEFMSGEYKDKSKKNKGLKTLVGGIGIAPLLAIAGHGHSALAAAPAAIPVNVIGDVTGKGAAIAGAAAGKEIIKAMSQLFDPIIDIIIGLSFPVACVMILWKLFISFFKDNDCWEGVGKICITYCIIQMFPIFVKILKTMGTLAIGI